MENSSTQEAMVVDKPAALLELQEFYNKKLWHQLTLHLLNYVQDPDVQKTEDLRKLYNEFIQPIENKMNCFTFVKIISYVIAQFTDAKEAIQFLVATEPKIKSDVEATIYCKILQGELHLEKLRDQEECKKIINEVEALLVDVNVIGIVHNRYYLLASQLYRVQAKHTEYYRTCLKYLGSLDISTVPLKERMQHAFLLSLAALLSDDIYNLGELLQHPVLDSLRNTPNQWIIDLLYAFNSGNIKKFEEMSPKWSSMADIAVQKSKLRKKISLLCIMELTFRKESKERRISFQEIANEAAISVGEVEHLVMKALSLGLVKGNIDQVAQEVNMNWVQPRVVDKSQIAAMSSRLDHWLQDVDMMKHVIEDRGTEFLKA